MMPIDEGDEDRDAGEEDDEDADAVDSDLDLELGEDGLEEGLPFGNSKLHVVATNFSSHFRVCKTVNPVFLKRWVATRWRSPTGFQ